MKLSETQLHGIYEFFRVLALGIIAYLLTEGLALLSVILGEQLPTETKYLIIGLTTTVLKAIDKFLHKEGQLIEEETGQESPLTTGITRF